MGAEIVPNKYRIIIDKNDGQSTSLVFKSKNDNGLGVMLARFLQTVHLIDMKKIRIFRNNEKIDEIEIVEVI